MYIYHFSHDPFQALSEAMVATPRSERKRRRDQKELVEAACKKYEENSSCPVDQPDGPGNIDLEAPEIHDQGPKEIGIQTDILCSDEQSTQTLVPRMLSR